MFAAAKTGSSFGDVHRDDLYRLRKRVKKNFFKKRYKKYCGIKKRVLYLHPLKEESL